MKQIREIRQVLNKKLSTFKRLKVRIEKSLAKAPEGRLVISSSHGVVQYYQTDDKKKRSYLDSSKVNIIASLAQKDYDLALQKEINKQERRIQKVLKELREKEIEEVYMRLHVCT